MDTSPVPGFITRKQAAERCQRAERTLQRYWSKAIEMKDSSVLCHLRLHTEDEQVIEGIDVTKERIEQLKKEGRNPTWFVEANWVEEKYGQRTDEVQQEPLVNNTKPVEEPSPVLTPNDSELIAALKSHIARLEQENDRRSNEHQQDKESFMEQIKMFKDMFDTLKEDHTDTKELLKEVHQVMGKFADVKLLGSQTTSPNTDAVKSEKQSDQDVIVDIENNATVEAVIVEHPKKPKKTSTKQGSQISRKKKVTTATSKSKKSSKAKSKQHKWYETPTLNRLISKTPRK